MGLTNVFPASLFMQGLKQRLDFEVSFGIGQKAKFVRMSGQHVQQEFFKLDDLFRYHWRIIPG